MLLILHVSHPRVYLMCCVYLCCVVGTLLLQIFSNKKLHLQSCVVIKVNCIEWTTNPVF